MSGALPRSLLPDSAEAGPDGGLRIGGCDVVELAARFGTPLFVYDEAQLQRRMREASDAFGGDGVVYATKAFLCRAVARLALAEGLMLDVATGGELHVALAAGAPAERLVLHGNNKSDDELRRALALGVGRIVVDSHDELDRLERLHRDEGHPPARVLVRVAPGVHADTHRFVMTGHDDQKFGFALTGGDAADAVDRCRRSPAVELLGVHAHIGSQIFALGSFAQGVELLAPFVLPLGVAELSLGGGLGVGYVAGEEAPGLTAWAEALKGAVADHGLGAHRLLVEPGRALVAGAAVTLYTVGTIKERRGLRTFVAVDGGMSDNPRPVLYGSGYETFLPRSFDAPRPKEVRVVGKHCESGDVLVERGWVPEDVRVGDVLATPVTGAYGHSMGSNYNKVTRPAVVFVRDGVARVVVRRETEDDLLLTDVG